MSHTALHTPLPYVVPAISRIAPAAELDQLRRTRSNDRLWAANGPTLKSRVNAQARLARLAELELREGEL